MRIKLESMFDQKMNTKTTSQLTMLLLLLLLQQDVQPLVQLPLLLA
jgi:hypothetical protein